ncbi:TniQ family protein [Pseudomonas moorei]|uniref:TniQ family protein n=1 Tax=Pseudomonas moorei TaxID=395599 RepID=UPI001FF29F5C|nr:TniQ family protein [Pseudomonas moorei]
MKTFNFIPLPIPGESPTSLIKRLALHNGYGNCSKFFEHHMRFKAPKATVVIQGSRFETLLISQVGPSLHQRLRQGFYALANPRSPGGAFKIGPLRIGRRLLRPRKAALCTECIKEGWERYIKDICLSTHCPVHNRHYLFECPHCQRKLTWKNQSSLLCICGGTLESPSCSPEEALAEVRLFEILKSGDQARLENLLTLISLLGVPRNRISTVCTPLIFSAATALVFEDYQAAAASLCLMIDPSDKFEIDIILAKLLPILPKDSLSMLKQQLESSTPQKKTIYQQVTVPAKCMRSLLGVGARKWREIRSTQSCGKKPVFSKLEALQIKEAHKTKIKLDASKKITEKQKLVAMCYTQHETKTLLHLSNPQCRMLETLELLSPLMRMASRPLFKKDEVNRLHSEYISVRELATRLGTSKAKLRRAIRITPFITSWHDQSGCLFLVKTTDIAAIEQCLSRLPKLDRKLSANRNIRTFDASSMHTMFLTQAAQHLKTHPNRVIYYRDLGLIRCTDNNTLQLSVKDIEEFYTNFSTSKQLAKELEVSVKKLRELLEPLKILPISGGITNGHPWSVYDRSTLPPNLKDLINPTHDSFGRYWMRAELYTLQDAAQQLGILFSDFQNFFTATIRPARVQHYRRTRKVSPDEIEHVRLILSSNSKLSALLIKRGITHAAFSRRFIHPKFVKITKINHEEYLSSSDLSKLETLLDKYCTPDEAAIILRLSPVRIYHQMRIGLLTPIFLAGYKYKHPLLEKVEVLNLSELRSSKNHQRYSPHPL